MIQKIDAQDLFITSGVKEGLMNCNKKYLYIPLSLLLIVFSSIQAYGFDKAQDDDFTDAKYIARNFWEGVVKILVYDPVVEEKFNLQKGDGYLTRGSGFIVSPEGIIFTNRHVIEWCVYGYMVADWEDEEGVLHHSDVLTYKPGLELKPEIKKVYFIGHAKPIIQVFTEETGKNFELYAAEVVSLGEAFDGAMLKIVSQRDGKPVKRLFKALPIGNSDKVELGEDLVILGYPSQYEKSDFSLDLRDTLTMTYGKHSGWDYVFDDIYGFIKTNASVHEGNSGGPVFGDAETVIGIATAMGLRTHIGLVEGINGMYYLVEPYKHILGELATRGLTSPSHELRYAAVSGKPRVLPDLSNLKKIDDPIPFASLNHHSVALKGIVIGTDTKKTVPDVKIEVWSLDKQNKKIALVSTAKTNAEGKFVLSQSIPLKRKYSLVFKANGYKVLDQELELGSKDQNFFTIHLQPI